MLYNLTGMLYNFMRTHLSLTTLSTSWTCKVHIVTWQPHVAPASFTGRKFCKAAWISVAYCKLLILVWGVDFTRLRVWSVFGKPSASSLSEVCTVTLPFSSLSYLIFTVTIGEVVSIYLKHYNLEQYKYLNFYLMHFKYCFLQQPAQLNFFNAK